MLVDDVLDPVKFIAEKQSDMLNNSVIEEIYQNICFVKAEKHATSEALINVLIKNYILNHQAPNNFLIKYLSDTPLQDVYTFFKENPHFAKELILEFYKNINHDVKLEYGPCYGIYAKYDSSFKVEFISKQLRDAFSRVYDNLTYTAGIPFSLSQTFVMLMQGMASVGGNEEMMADAKLLKEYYPLFIRLVYADVYEDLVASNLMDKDQMRAVYLVKEALATGNFQMPENNDERDSLLSYFNYLVCDEQKRVANRRIVKETNTDNLKKINP